MLSNTLALVLLLAAPPAQHQAHLRYVGNSGFEITDGSSVILIDFPYESGAYGYMTFEPTELRARSDSLCLFTHRHADHFDPEALSSIGCSIAGPPEVLAKARSVPQLEGHSQWKFGGASIRCLQSEHGDVQHCSYLVTWCGSTVLIAGDVETLGSLLEHVEQLDLLLVPHWLTADMSQVHDRFPGAKVVLSHQLEGEQIELCRGCVVLSQGESIEW